MTRDVQRNARKWAAVVYDEGVAVDLLLEVFAQNLIAQGVRVGGVLHVPRGEARCGPDTPLRLHDLYTGQVVPLCRQTAIGTRGCAIDPTALSTAARSVRAALDERAQIVFISRFGKLELHGGGFRGEHARGALSSCAVLTAVRRGLRDDWLAFTGGAGALLEARLGALTSWWQEIDPNRGECAYA